MQDFDAPSSKRVLAELAKEGAWNNLLKLARWRTGAEADAEDLVANALARVFDPDDMPWLPEKGGFYSHMGNVIRHVWGRHVRKVSVKREVIDTGIARDETMPSLEPAADEELHRQRTVALRRALVETVLETIGDKYPRVREVYKLSARGIDDPSEQAKELRCGPEEVYLAVKTLKRFVRAAHEKWEQEEERRMKELREKAS